MTHIMEQGRKEHKKRRDLSARCMAYSR